MNPQDRYTWPAGVTVKWMRTEGGWCVSVGGRFTGYALEAPDGWMAYSLRHPFRRRGLVNRDHAVRTLLVEHYRRAADKADQAGDLAAGSAARGALLQLVNRPVLPAAEYAGGEVLRPAG